MMGAGNSGRRIRGDVAIIGMAALFPGARDLATYWHNILGKVDCVSDPPADAWDAGIHFDPSSRENDRVYCKKGGYLGPVAYFDPLEFGVMPLAVDGGEPDQWLALRVATRALADAGYLEKLEVRHRTAVVIGRGTYLNRGNFSLVQHGEVVDQTLGIVSALHPEFGPGEMGRIRQELKRQLPPLTAETVPGLIPNIIAGRIANRLDLMGPAYTVDAACASSLIALQSAMRDLLTHECDMALVGGSQITTPVPTLALFCLLGALSRRQQIRPFDKDADGTILGEGIGMVVLKRREDAERDGDRIYALVKGVGTASDGRGVGVMAPRVEGEELAMRRAYEATGIDPSTIELIEAHGTGTPVGDATEIQALMRVFGARKGEIPHCALGSVKSMIGHTMPAAGIAGVIKTALALYQRVVPPTLNVTEPNPSLELHSSPFYLNVDARPWIHGNPNAPRRAGVSAFGFGGINAHALLEEYPHSDEIALPTPQTDWDSEAVVLQAHSAQALISQVDALGKFLENAADIALKDLAYTINMERADGPWRLGLVVSSIDDLSQKLRSARDKLAAPNCQRIKDVSGIYFFAEQLGPKGKLAVLFPGEGAQYPQMLADLCALFPEVRAPFDQMDRVFWNHPRGYRTSDLVFPPAQLPAEKRAKLERLLWQIDGAVEAVLTANQALWVLMSRLGLRADFVVGHSTGEYSAMRAAGVLDLDDEVSFARFARELNRSHQAWISEDGVPRAAMLAVGAERDEVAHIARDSPGALYVAMDNCPHQAVIVGERSTVEKARALAEQRGLVYEFLTFDRAYHTPLFAQYAEHLREVLAQVPISPARLPIYSCTTAAPYPDDAGSIRDLMVEHWSRPVEFRQTIEKLYESGARIFVEVGPRGNLSAFVEDILRGRPFCAVPTNVQRRSGVAQINHCVALLSAQGVDLNLEPLYERRRSRKIALDESGSGSGGTRRERRLATGFPVLRLPADLAQDLRRVTARLDGSQFQDAASPAGTTSPAAPGRENGRGASDHGALAMLQPEAAVTPPRVEADYPETPDDPIGPPALEADDEALEAALQAYLVTMDRFLAVEEEIVQAYLRPAQVAPPVPDGDGEAPGPMASPPSPAVRAESSTLPASQHDGLGKSDQIPGAHPPYPLLGTAISWVPERELVTRRTFDPSEDLYLLHHTLGRGVSAADSTLSAMAVMPLAMSMEIMAEAAACLAPGQVVVGMNNIRANRWIAFEQEPQTLEITARRVAKDDSRIAVQIRNPTEDAQCPDRPQSPVLEATVVMGADYPQPPPTRLRLAGGEPSRWRPDQLYSDVMFHGPLWQGVSAIERTAEGGSVARLSVLPFRGYFGSNPEPHFELDPVVLDAAGQVIGFWTMERLATAKLIFPFRVEALELFGPLRPDGEAITCTASIQLVGEQHVRSDIELVSGDGPLWMRLVGWEDKRFSLPEPFHRLMLAPGESDVSTPWPRPLPRLLDGSRFRCRCVSAGLESDHSFWKRVWAHCVLSRRERELFRALRTPEPRQIDWLAGRTAAKDAVRSLLRDLYGLEVLPADVEILPDPQGRPLVFGRWLDAVPEPPMVSIAHSDGFAVALAAAGGTSQPGIDVEHLRDRPAGFGELAFDDDERRLLLEVPADNLQEWMLRLWCAKEAVSKALGQGLIEGPTSVLAVAIDRVRDTVAVRVNGQLAKRHPEAATTPLLVWTACRDDLVVAASIIQRSGCLAHGD